MAVEEGVFKHQCIHPECDRIVEFDDEPWCFTHSPDEGSSLFGWSARAALTDKAEEIVVMGPGVKNNIFADGTKLPGEG